VSHSVQAGFDRFANPASNSDRYRPTILCVPALAALWAMGISSPAALAQPQPVEAPSSNPSVAAASVAVPSAASSSQPASAATKPAAPRPLHEPDLQTLKGTPSGDLTRHLLSSAFIVLVLGAVCYAVMKKVVPRIQSRGGRNIHILETAHLGPQKTVHLLKVGEATYLVASTRDRVSLLAEIPPAAASRLASSPPAETRAPAGGEAP
jgi:flagellar biogenesis protein FliO